MQLWLSSDCVPSSSIGRSWPLLRSFQLSAFLRAGDCHHVLSTSQPAHHASYTFHSVMLKMLRSRMQTMWNVIGVELKCWVLCRVQIHKIEFQSVSARLRTTHTHCHHILVFHPWIVSRVFLEKGFLYRLKFLCHLLLKHQADILAWHVHESQLHHYVQRLRIMFLILEIGIVHVV